MSSIPDPTLVRLLEALARFTRIRQELHWLKHNEPDEYRRLVDELKKALDGNS